MSNSWKGIGTRKAGVRHRTVKTLGRLDELTAYDPDYLENLKQQFGSERASKKQAVAAPSGPDGRSGGAGPWAK